MACCNESDKSKAFGAIVKYILYKHSIPLARHEERVFK